MVLVAKRQMLDLQFHTLETPDEYGLFAIQCQAQQPQQRFSSRFFFVVNFLFQLDTENIFAVRIHYGMFLYGYGIYCGIFNLFFAFSDFSRETDGNFVLQFITLAVMGSFQCFKTGQLHVQVHLFLDKRIACRQCLDLGIGQRGLVHIIAAASRRF